MVYSFQLIRHPNIHYRQAVIRLSQCELTAMLKNLAIEAEIRVRRMGGADFLVFECRELSPEEISWLSGHSCIVFMAESRGDYLIPLQPSFSDAFSPDLPEILKYKGKTNPTLTRMMLNTVLSLASFPGRPQMFRVLDPLCGKGTTLFCALCAGCSAVGMDLDGKALKEAADYFSRYLKMHRIKHTLRAHSETVGRQSVPVTSFSFGFDRSSSGNAASLDFFLCDSSFADRLLRKRPAHVLIADLPYGVQHAPSSEGRTGTFASFLRDVLPSWKKAVLPGGAIALSYNTLTLSPSEIRRSLSAAGFVPIEENAFSGLEHRVEQAVTRDIVFALAP